jgi:Leucine-rich repeat (LRR) protein
LGDDVYIYSTEVDYAAGTQYKYTFTIDTRNPQGMTLSTTDIEEWRDDANPTEETLSDIITFTDPKFKEYLLQEKFRYDVELGYDEDGSYIIRCREDGRIDANNDGEISIAEAEKVEWIDVMELGISDMRQLHVFINLKLLRCYNNELTTLDVSKNTALTALYCGGNQLTTLDVSNNTALTRLICSGNQLTSLDVSNNTALADLDCNPMNDANGNNLLETIYIANGQVINNLDMPDATNIEEK